MRTPDIILKIKESFSNPDMIENFVSDEEINHLVSIFENSDDRNAPLIYKNTGPISLDIQNYLTDRIIEKIIKKIKEKIENFEITAAFFFKTDYPHIIHNDDTFELPDSVYKAINIPLKFYGDFKEVPKLCFFDQCYYHGPAKFFYGDTDLPTYYNKQVYEYTDVEGISDIPFDKKTYLKYFTHLDYSWLHGLNLKCVIDQQIGSAIIFDSVRLHCSNDFRKQGIQSKLALSIFTKKL